MRTPPADEVEDRRSVGNVDAEVAALVKDGAKLLIHDPGRFAYVDAGGPGGAIFELMAKRT